MVKNNEESADNAKLFKLCDLKYKALNKTNVLSRKKTHSSKLTFRLAPRK